MTIKESCHCGATQFTAKRPATVTRWTCSFWAYQEVEEDFPADHGARPGLDPPARSAVNETVGTRRDLGTRLLRPWERPVVIVILIATEVSRATSLLRHRAVRHQRACHSVQNRRERALHFIRHSITGHQLQEQMPYVFQRANRTERKAVAILGLQLHELGV
jgi:hypothetical protein